MMSGKLQAFLIRSEDLLLVFFGFCDYETMKNLKTYIFFIVFIG